MCIERGLNSPFFWQKLKDMILHIDIETYSSESIKNGVYKYADSPDFEILLFAYAFGSDPVEIVDLAMGDVIPPDVLRAVTDPSVKKYAHNAQFERVCISKHLGLSKMLDPSQWYCTSVLALFSGLPASLAHVGSALGFGSDKAKLSTGKALIKYFCVPCRPTKVNGGRTRNYYHHDPEKWDSFKTYCVQDVVTEREVHRSLRKLEKLISPEERAMYVLDQRINDNGVLIAKRLVNSCISIDMKEKEANTQELKALTGLDNPNSTSQLCKWLEDRTGEKVKSIAKAAVEEILEEHADNEDVVKALTLRKKLAKSSNAKYYAMRDCVCSDGRAHGLLQFYGGARTGRWAGRLIQLQNLPQNKATCLDTVRALAYEGPDARNLLRLIIGDVSFAISQLIRTCIISPKGKIFGVADFSAIEARFLAWLVDEGWRMEVFRSHGKIYEASAAMMFNVPLEAVTKGSELRATGKIAELALGYQGAVGALESMEISMKIPEEKRLTTVKKKDVVAKWREANPAISGFWKEIEDKAKKAIINPKYLNKSIPVGSKGLRILYNGHDLFIFLPSGRPLIYRSPRISTNKFGSPNIQFLGYSKVTGAKEYVDTYGGKLTENIVQAGSRDLLRDSMLNLEKAGFRIVMHVHDEAIAELDSPEQLKDMVKTMEVTPTWAEDFPLIADGYTTKYYKKD